MNKIFFSFLLMSFLGFSVFAEKADVKKTERNFPTPPAVKKGEYALFLDDKYTTFKTIKWNKYELDTSCFKANKKKPECMAYEYTQIKKKDYQLPDPSMNNAAAFICSKRNGKNLIALDYKKNEIDFCRFPDGSMVNSWNLAL